MESMTVTSVSSLCKIRILVRDQGQDQPKAVLPPLVMTHPKASGTIPEDLVIRTEQHLSAVPVVDEKALSSCELGVLCGAIASDGRSLHCEVDVAAHRKAPRDEHRLIGVSEFYDLHHLRSEVPR